MQYRHYSKNQSNKTLIKVVKRRRAKKRFRVKQDGEINVFTNPSSPVLHHKEFIMSLFVGSVVMLWYLFYQNFTTKKSGCNPWTSHDLKSLDNKIIVKDNARMIPLTANNISYLNKCDYVQLANNLKDAVTKGKYKETVKRFMLDSYNSFYSGDVRTVEKAINNYSKDKNKLYFIVKYDNECCGVVNLHSSGQYGKKTCEIAYFCNPTKNKTKNGLFTILLSRFITKLFSDKDEIFQGKFKDIERLNIAIDWYRNNKKKQNQRSKKVAENLNFEELSNLDLYDEWVYLESKEDSKVFFMTKQKWGKALELYNKKFSITN